MNVERKSGAAAWLTVAVTAVGFMGAYVFLIVLARTPGVGRLFPDQLFFQTALITHVVLALVIWFLAFVIFVMHYVTPETRTGYADRVTASGALLGILIIVITPFTGPANPTLNNYVPALDRGLYVAGVGVFFVFAALGAALRMKALGASSRPLIVRGSLMVAGLALISALICFGVSWVGLNAAGGRSAFEAQYYYEILFWGGGHVLQFANTLGMMAVWALLAERLSGRTPMPDAVAKPILILISLLIVAAPIMYMVFDYDSPALRSFFTNLKAWGLSFGPLILGVFIVRQWGGETGDPVARRGFALAMILFGLGGGMALLIDGADTRVPAHYHGVIGGVTLSFMTLALVALTENGWLTARDTWKKFQVTLYGVGQALFVGGLFVGGLAGLARKTFGAAQELDTTLKYTGMGIMALGGLLAIVSGGFFVVFMIRALMNGRRA